MERILLVEDEKTNLRILSAYLRKTGHEVDEAEDGEAAWEKLNANSNYALVVTDRNMPRMNGLELFKKIHSSAALRNIPVIMQTAADTPEEVVEGIKAGVYYYLTKPYQEETLLTVVKSAIAERRQNEWIRNRLIKQNEAMGKFVRGEFHIQNLEEAQNLAFLLGSLFPRPEVAVSSLYELLLNAIEHGNLALGYIEKGKLLAAAKWESEIATRLQSPQNLNKKVVVQFVQDGKQLEVLISDEGLGFDWRPFMDIEPSRATQSHGRGIAKANLVGFDQLVYKGNGSQVQVITKLAA